MIRSLGLGLLVLVSLNLSVRGEPVPLSAAEIATLLTGNTAVGTWQETPYRQFFGTGGGTLYAPRGGRESWGKWRVNAETNRYESWWEQADWAGYEIARDDGQLFWITTSLPPQPFEVLPGRQMKWPE